MKYATTITLLTLMLVKPAAALDLFPRLPDLFTRKYEAKLAEYCSVKSGDRGQVAYEIGWFLLNAREREWASIWLHRAAELGHERAAPLVKALPQTHRPAPRCKGEAGPSGEHTRFINAPAQTVALVRRIAPQFGLEPELVLAVIAVESGFQPDAVSPKNARGLMQLLPETAEWLRVDDIFDPAENVRGGAKYLAWLLKSFGDDLPLTLAAYNAGPQAVRRFDGIPPYDETRQYVQAVQGSYERYKQLAMAGAGKRTGAQRRR